MGQGQKEIAAGAESRFFLFSATIRDFLPQKATELQSLPLLDRIKDVKGFEPHSLR